ncbi:MAG: hypothetical protein AAF568_01765 [Pseudomonadota bacterium]
MATRSVLETHVLDLTHADAPAAPVWSCIPLDHLVQARPAPEPEAAPPKPAELAGA